MNQTPPPSGDDSIQRTAAIAADLARRAEEMPAATAETFARRGLLLAQAGPLPGPEAQHELQRMGAEKAEATFEAGWVVWEAAFTLPHHGVRVALTQWQLASALWSWDWFLHPAGLARAQQRLLAAWSESQEAILALLPLAAETARQEVRPFHRRITANAQRLAAQQTG